MARPTKYTEELGKEICQRIASGETVLSISKDPDMPASSSIYLWLLDENKKEFSENYAQARMAQADYYFDQLIEIADDKTKDDIDFEREDGSVTSLPNKEHMARSRLRVDTRKWYLSKVLPKKFGDKLDVTSGDKPIQGNAITFIPMNNEADSK